MRYCCTNCFANSEIKRFIEQQEISGNCDYCNAADTFIIDTEQLGQFFRECFDKAYEAADSGTGAYLDPEDKVYCGPSGNPAILYSIMDILERENAFPDEPNIQLIEDIISTSGPSLRDIINGDVDPYSDIYAENYVIKDDLYGVYGTETYYTWEQFKFLVKHYNRFFDVDNFHADLDCRKRMLNALRPLFLEYEKVIPGNSVFYRARKHSCKLNFDTLIIDKELSPAPPSNAQANRMSPSGISYLYVSSTARTACKECRYKDCDVIMAKYRSTDDLQIIDFSQDVCFPSSSIFSEEYDHDTNWLTHFLRLFSKEISKPVNPDSDRSYEYVATQFVAEYIRSLGYDGIAFKSSVDQGVNYCFFCGPNLRYCKNEYGIFDETVWYPTLPSFRDQFTIDSISLFHASESEELLDLHRTRLNCESN